MELEGFTGSFHGKTVVVFVEREEEAWVPWECLPDGMTVLLCGKIPRTHRMVRDGSSWSSIWSPSSSREWSILATVLKAAGGPIILVLDLDAPLPPFAFTEFLESLSSITKVYLAKQGSAVGVFGHPHAVIWSDGCSVSARKETLYALRYSVNEETIAAAITAAIESKVYLMASTCDGSWKLYWIRPSDSWLMVKGLGETARGLLRTGMALLDIN
jgi:hypothetical protein